MDKTPRGNRLHIAIFGNRNVGKSSLINALTNQEIALVSPVPGTTADPVYKSMEILPIGPVVLIDTAGIDDQGELGELRVKRSIDVLKKTDLAILVFDAGKCSDWFENKIIYLCNEKGIPLIPVINKVDKYENINEQLLQFLEGKLSIRPVLVSALNKKGIGQLKEAIIKSAPIDWDNNVIVGDIIHRGDVIILVVPIDKAAPKGRLILPQVQTIRDILDHGGIAIVVKDTELKDTIEGLGVNPKLVITDSQVFEKVSQIVSKDIPLTSFSILFARNKGDLNTLAEGALAINNLKSGDKVLISEACTHHRVEDDIGTKKLPNLLNEKVGGELAFNWSSGSHFPEDIKDYKLIIHCGGCMINRREILSRIAIAREWGVPITNYGLCIAMLKGILERSLECFKQENPQRIDRQV